MPPVEGEKKDKKAVEVEAKVPNKLKAQKEDAIDPSIKKLLRNKTERSYKSFEFKVLGKEKIARSNRKICDGNKSICNNSRLEFSNPQGSLDSPYEGGGIMS